jgi:Glycine zipper
MRNIVMLGTVLALAGCSGVDSETGKRTAIGAGVGAAGGAIIGAVTGRPGTGAAAGAVLGAASGAVLDQIQKGDEAKQVEHPAPLTEEDRSPMFKPRDP